MIKFTYAKKNGDSVCVIIPGGIITYIACAKNRQEDVLRIEAGSYVHDLILIQKDVLSDLYVIFKVISESI